MAMTKLTEGDWSRLEQYVRGELSTVEADEVSQMLQQNSDWSDAYNDLKVAQQAGRLHFRNKMKQQFKQIDSERQQGATRRILPWIGAAASILILVVFTLQYLGGSQEGDILASYEKLPNVAFPIEKSSTAEDTRTRAYQAYELSEYQNAVDAFELLEVRDVRDELYRGIALFELGSLQESRSALMASMEIGDNRWSPVAEWYLVFVDAADGQYDAAWERLERISRSRGHQYQEKASRLLADR